MGDRYRVPKTSPTGLYSRRREVAALGVAEEEAGDDLVPRLAGLEVAQGLDAAAGVRGRSAYAGRVRKRSLSLRIRRDQSGAWLSPAYARNSMPDEPPDMVSNGSIPALSSMSRQTASTSSKASSKKS